MPESITYVSKSGSRYTLDEEGFLLRNGQRDWFDDGNSFIFCGLTEKERRDFWGYLRVHDVFLDFGSGRPFVKDGFYLYGITPTRLDQLRKEIGFENIRDLYNLLHKEDPTQEYPHSARSSTIVSLIEE